MRISRFLILLLLFITPIVAIATSDFAPNCVNLYPSDDAGLFKDVACPCVKEGACSAIDFMRVVFNASQLLFKIAGAVALLMFIAGGFMLIISSGNQTYVDRGKEILRAAVIGLVIIFTAWIIINLIIVLLAGPEAGGTIFSKDWWEIDL